MNFNWNNPYLTSRTPLFAHNVAATSHPLAAQAGLHAMMAGGNAADAAIAAAATLTVAEPISNGLGSDAFAMVWDGKQLHGLNASGTAPSHWNPSWFAERYGVDGKGHAKRPQFGWDSVTIPGAVAGWGALHQRFGKLPFSRVLETAIEIAQRGVTITPMAARKWHAMMPLFAAMPGFTETFIPNGHAPITGEKFMMPGAAKTLRLLADQGARAFYEGEPADAMVSWAKKTGGLMNSADLAACQPEWVTPLQRRYRGYDVHELPPNGQGITALIALGLLEQFDITDLPPDGAESLHLQIEAVKLAFADVYQYVADPASMRVTPQQMLDDAYLAQRARLINRYKATQPSAGIPASGGTVYLTTADENGMMVSFIQSNYMGFGSGVVVPDYGISLQNRGAGFSSDPRSANVVAGGKRPFHTIIPAFLTKDGQAQMSFGVTGGDIQPQGHLQTLVRMLDYHQQPQSACDAPRWKVNPDYSLDIESGFNADVAEHLLQRGHRLNSVEDSCMDFGSGQFIWRLSGDGDHGYVAASDSRREGQAVGF